MQGCNCNVLILLIIGEDEDNIEDMARQLQEEHNKWELQIDIQKNEIPTYWVTIREFYARR